MHWLIEMNLLLAGFAIIYVLAFRKDKMLVFNRTYLLAALLSSAIVPHLNIVVGSSSPIQTLMVQLPTITVGSGTTASTAPTPATGWDWASVIVLIWSVGTAVLALRFTYRWIKLGLYIRKNRHYSVNGIHWIHHDGPICTVGPYVLAPTAWHGQTGHPVIQHELVHMRQGHTADVILAEIVAILCWINPFAYKLKNSLREVHEYLADDHVLKTQEVDRMAYCQWIIQLATRQATPVYAHTFSPSPIKNRLAMLHEHTQWKAALIKRALLLPLVAVTLLFTACEKDSSPASASDNPTANPQGEAIEVPELPSRDYEDIYKVVEQMPEYEDGKDGLMQFLSSEIKYPESLLDKEGVTEAMVYVQFVVGKDGKATNFSVANADKVDPAFTKAALSAMAAMGNWTPGKQRGESVAVSYTLPIKFVPPAENE